MCPDVEPTVKDLEDTLLNYIKTRPPTWAWFLGRKKFGRDETVERFRKDKEFRRLVMSSALIKAVNDFKV